MGAAGCLPPHSRSRTSKQDRPVAGCDWRSPNRPRILQERAPAATGHQPAVRENRARLFPPTPRAAAAAVSSKTPGPHIESVTDRPRRARVRPPASALARARGDTGGLRTARRRGPPGDGATGLLRARRVLD
eukprot:scaffold2191_cov392-Prasinococcus_capsulatus_cf.AAC.1